VRDGTNMATRLRTAESLPAVLAAGFDAFEFIRKLARHSQDRAPGLFAAFMFTADAAVDGREAITIAPSLPPADSPAMVPIEPAASDNLEEVTETLAALGALLNERLTRAADTSDPADRAACEEAAAAAQRIAQLMSRDGDDRDPR